MLPTSLRARGGAAAGGTPRGEPEPGSPELAAAAEAPAEPLWQRLWRAKLVQIGVLVAALLMLTGIYFFQHPLVRRPVLYDRLRLASCSSRWSGSAGYAHAQLSVVNVLTFTNSLLTGFSWEPFLVDPLIFILWFSVAAGPAVLGARAVLRLALPVRRAAGAGQPRGASRAHPAGTVPWGLHERLWPVKYIIFLVLFGLSLYSLALAEQMSEVEPFKTAIVLHFMREWWFVAFAWR